jgi:RNA polymerase sigma factor (sigma-70 family)
VGTDEELMGQLASKNQVALEDIHNRYHSLLFSVALRITGDRGSAEEILQDTFFQLWRKASQFDAARGSLVGWLLTMVRYRAISRMRGKSDHFCSESPCGADVSLPSSAGSTALEQEIARELVSAALASLSSVQRDAIRLAYFSGLTAEEISLRTKTPLGTTKSRLRSALQGMKKALSNPGLSVSGERTQPSATLVDILVTEQLLSRPLRQRFPHREKESLQVLAHVVATSPERLTDAFLQMALDLCSAGTAGLSFLETDAEGTQVFRWTNLAGELKKYVGGTTPRNFSPCGVTLDRNSPQLFAYPGRYFPYFNDVETPIVEGLVIPFRVADTEGTLWIASHEEGILFDAEDARIMTVLTEFASCAFHFNRSISASPAPL